MSDEKRPPGRPLEYKPEYCAMVEKMSAAGLMDQQIADILGIALSTFCNWKDRFPEFMEANAKGKAISNAEIQASLYKAAKGGYVVKEVIKDADGVVVRTKEKEMPIDATAAMKILHNRDPKNWREKVEVEHSGSVDMSQLSPEEFEAKKAAILEAYLQKKE